MKATVWVQLIHFPDLRSESAAFEVVEQKLRLRRAFKTWSVPYQILSRNTDLVGSIFRIATMTTSISSKLKVDFLSAVDHP